MREEYLLPTAPKDRNNDDPLSVGPSEPAWRRQLQVVIESLVATRFEFDVK
ncbi:MAG TPA: hypothetical protein VER68_03605 [Azonexus sp.]|nr:hypothetical protein [Azonexus sp.]